MVADELRCRATSTRNERCRRPAVKGEGLCALHGGNARRCTARNRSGKRCQKPAIRGGTVCVVHGGKTPGVIAKARERVEMERVYNLVYPDVRERLQTAGTWSVSDAYQEILKTTQMAVQWRDAMAEQVANLADIRYRASGAGTEQLRAEVALFERALDRVARIAESLARLNLDARIASIAARQGDLVATAIRRAIDAVPGLTTEQRAAFDGAIARELRRIVDEGAP